MGEINLGGGSVNTTDIKTGVPPSSHKPEKVRENQLNPLKLEIY